MKTTTKLMFLLMPALLLMGFIGCSVHEHDPDPVDEEEIPDFVLGQDSIRVKIGAGNKATVTVKEGGGEYNAFCLDKNLANAEVVNGAITVEGFANGQTLLIISDKHTRYRRLPVSVYTTDVLELSSKELNLVTKLGQPETIEANVVLGNGGYKVQSSNKAVLASVTKEGKISITVTSKKADYTAVITVTDSTNLTASITVSVKASMIPFTDEELKTIMANNTRRYFYNGYNTYNNYYAALNKTLDDGKQRYGWDYYDVCWLYIDFAGGKAVGTKSDARFNFQEWPDEIIFPVTLKIIKNDGTNIWGTFFYIDDKKEEMNTGYFCDTVNP